MSLLNNSPFTLCQKYWEFQKSDRQKLVTWMEFLELAQYIQVDQMKKELDAEQSTGTSKY